MKRRSHVIPIDRDLLALSRARRRHAAWSDDALKRLSAIVCRLIVSRRWILARRRRAYWRPDAQSRSCRIGTAVFRPPLVVGEGVCRLSLPPSLEHRADHRLPGTSDSCCSCHPREARGPCSDTPQVYRAPYDDLQGLGRHFEDVAKHGYSYSSGICIGSNASEPAKALQAFLSAPAAASVIRKNGMDPSHP